MRKTIFAIAAVFSTIFSAATLSAASRGMDAFPSKQSFSTHSGQRFLLSESMELCLADSEYSLPPVDTSVSTIVPVYSPTDCKLRLEKLNSEIPLDYNRYVQAYINAYALRKREQVCRMLALSEYYFPTFEQVLEEAGLPAELKYLAAVESALNPYAKSRVGATGIWQFMRTTAKVYGLHMDDYVDERQDPYKASLAAAQYFKNMYAKYGDWLLVIAAYNCGPGNVNRAIRRSGGHYNFWKIMPFLPRETRGYVPAYIAATYIFNYAEEHNLYPVYPAFAMQSEQVTINKPLRFEQIAATTGISIEELKFFNPLFKKQLLPAFNGEEFVLNIPSNRIDTFVMLLDTLYKYHSIEHESNQVMLVSNSEPVKSEKSVERVKTKVSVTKTHKVRKGENLSLIADKYNVSVQDIRKWNKLTSSKINAGKALVIKTHETRWVTKPVKGTQQSETVVAKAESKKRETLPTDKNSSGKFVYHRVERGDTLWSIAQRYEGATVESLKRLNNIKSSQSIKPGMMLKVNAKG